MSDTSTCAEVVTDGMAALERNRGIVTAWASAVGMGLSANRSVENLELAKETAARLRRVLNALESLIIYEVDR